MKRRTLSKRERRQLQRDDGALAERLVASEYQSLRDDGDNDADHDLEGSNTRAEVKSTFTEIGNSFPASGRFRLWQQQHEPLVEFDRDHVAWYVFVLYTFRGDDVIALMKRRKPAKVGRQVGARGGWNRSGHPKGRQHKLPHSAVFPGVSTAA